MSPVTDLEWPANLLALRALYEDDAVIVVDKPAGLPCQSVGPTRPQDLPTLLRGWLARRRGLSEDQIYVGTHQRLDQHTSGAILYSVAERANPALAEQFAGRTLEKHYLAAVHGEPPAAGTQLVHALAREGGGQIRVAAEPGAGAKSARSRVLSVRRAGERSLVRLAIETGRTHQVRVQLAAVGCPVAGDSLYGGAPALRMLLHAERLAFDHPDDGRRVTIESPAPLEFEDWLAHGARSAHAHGPLLERACELALWRRASLLFAHAAGETTAYRLLNDAADGVGGFSAEVFDGWAVLRADAEPEPGSSPVETERALIAALERLRFRGVYLKRHPRQASRLVDPTEEHVASRLPVAGEVAPSPLIVRESGVPFEVQLGEGLRTGLYLDQRDNRLRLRELARGKAVLNLFGYTGSLSVAALLGDARSVTTLDLSRAALAWAERNVALNDDREGRSQRHTIMADDAFTALRRLEQRGRRFDLIILDPPSYSTSKRGRFRAAQDYASLCELALRVLTEPGALLACINHRGVSRDALRRFIHAAARGAGFEAPSLRDLPTGIDFPTELGRERGMKSVLAEFRARRGLRSHSAPLPEPAQTHTHSGRKKTRR